MNSTTRSHKEQEQLSFNQKVSDLIRKYRTALLIVLGAILLAVIVVALWSAIHGAAVKSSTLKLEKVEDDVVALSSEQDATKKAELEKTVSADLDAIIAKWPRLYAGQRAHALKARLAAEKKDWAAAEKDWIAVVDANKSSYLAAVALQAAAAAADERGAPEKATEYYKRFVDKYPNAAGLAHAYFSLGRLAEEGKEYAGAQGYYEKVVAGYPDDDWTKLAKDRILSLKSRGLTK